MATTTSASDGSYTFGNLAPEVYTIEEIVMPGWYITQPTNPPGTYTLSAQSGVTVTGLDFGDFKTISVTGDIYNDLDGNGLRGSGEPGLAGWTVDLEDSSGNVLASVLTDSNGNYAFTGVGGGSYQVAEVVPTELGADPAALSDQLLVHLQERPEPERRSSSATTRRPP